MLRLVDEDRRRPGAFAHLAGAAARIDALECARSDRDRVAIRVEPRLERTTVERRRRGFERARVVERVAAGAGEVMVLELDATASGIGRAIEASPRILDQVRAIDVLART